MIKFFYNNLVETAQLSASTTNAQYPLSNLQHDFRTKNWRSTTNSDSVVFDMGSIEPVDTIALVDNWRNGFGVSTITIEANATDSWGAPAFTTTMTFDSTFGIGIKELSSEQNYRYWRLVLTSTLGYCELANIFIGKATTIPTNGVDYGFSYKNKDMKKVSKTRYGQEYIDDMGSQKELNSLKFSVMNTTEMDAIYEVYDNRRTVKPFFVKIGDNTNSLVSNENRFNGFYKLKTEPSAKSTTAFFFEVTLSVREQK